MAFCGVVFGLLLDGGSIQQVVQPTAALIVLGGTLGAIMIQFPMTTLTETARQLRHGLFEPSVLASDVAEQLVGYCARVRRHGMLTLDPHLDEIEDDFLRKALTLAVDGVAVQEVQRTLDIDLARREEEEETIPRVLEAAGGFAPTLGIVGAVLGLIQVMQRMNQINEMSKGIAVAFVSTLYGIGLANLLLFPLAGRLRIRTRERQVAREMTTEAVLAMMEGISARALRRRLGPYGTAHPAESQHSLELAAR